MGPNADFSISIDTDGIIGTSRRQAVLPENLAVAAIDLGVLVKSRREATIDPMTARPYTQLGLAKALGVSRSTVNAIENGETESIDADKANRLAELLDVSVDELVRAMGFQVTGAGLAADEAELLRVYRRAPAGARPGVLSIARSAVQTLLELQNPKEPPRRAVG